MIPILFSFGAVHLYSYGLMIALGVLASIFLMERQALKTSWISKSIIQDMVMITIFAGFFGARLFYVVKFSGEYLANPIRIFAVWEGGLIFYGGLFASLPALAFYLRKHKIPFLKGLDFIIPYVALTHAFGRIGCFLNGCCHGKQCDLPWAVSFPEGPYSIHPAQLYEAFGLLIIFLFLVRRFQKHPFQGEIFSFYLMVYGLLRWIMECFRDNPVFALGWTFNQWISLGITLAGVGLYFWRKSAAEKHSL